MEAIIMTVRVAILGGPRCGKTTLMQQLYVDMKIAGLDVGCASEYSTDYLREKGMIETISEQYGIYLGQLKLEDELSVFDHVLKEGKIVEFSKDVSLVKPEDFDSISKGQVVYTGLLSNYAC